VQHVRAGAVMPLHVYTARLYSYTADDAIDITRANADKAHRAGRPFPGEPFAPSWTILRPALADRDKVERLQALADREAEGGDPAAASVLLDSAKEIEAGMWKRYVPAFTAEMRASYRRHRTFWDGLLALDRVTLCCFCANHLHCHRRILAGTILPALRAIDCGEIETGKGKAA
jgi:hypothetical protein